MLQRTIRAHGNFTEYVPLSLMFLIALEWMQALKGLLWMARYSIDTSSDCPCLGINTDLWPITGQGDRFFRNLASLCRRQSGLSLLQRAAIFLVQQRP